MHKTVIALALAAVLLLPALGSARAQGYSLVLATPVAFDWIQDADPDQSVQASSPSGFRAALGTPIGVFVGIGRYEADLEYENPALQVFNRTVSYAMTEVGYTFDLNVVHLGLGFGFGSATIDPETASNGFFTQTLEPQDARESMLLLGIPLTEGFSLQAAYHVLVVDLDVTENGVPRTDDIGASMVTAGVGLHF